MCLAIYLLLRRKFDEMAHPTKSVEGEVLGKSRQFVAAFMGEVNVIAQEKLAFLNCNVEPWALVQLQWTDTLLERQAKLSTTTIAQYFNTFPALKQPLGYTLLLEDFAFTYPGKEHCLHLNVPKKVDKITKAARDKAKQTRDKDLKADIQYLLSLIDGSLIALSCGSMIAWSSPALPMLAKFGSRPEVSPEQGSWVGSLLTLGAFIGAIPGGMLADRLGRKRLLLYMSVPLYASWSILMWTISVHGLYIGRFLGGLVIGVVSVTIPMYINEISDSSIRGTLGTFFQLQIVIGILVQYLFGLFGDVFRMTLTSSFIPILFFIIFYFFPESPVWLSERGQREEAKKSLQWLQLPSNTIQTTQREETQTLSVMQVLKDVPARRGLMISLGLMLFQQICGVNAVVFYTNEVYKKTGTSIEPFTASLITAVVQVCSTFVSTILIDRAGRRLLLLVSYAVMTTCLGALGFFIYLTQDRGHDLPGLSLLPVIAICTYCFVFNFGAGPVAWIMMAELVRPAARGVISAATAAVSWGLAFVVTKTFEDLTLWIGAGQTFGLFGVGAFLGGIFVMAFVPETKGKDVEYVVKKLSKRTSKNNVLI